ncbi:hypothetical protein ES703_36618 [subsurface metagenome]
MSDVIADIQCLKEEVFSIIAEICIVLIPVPGNDFDERSQIQNIKRRFGAIFDPLFIDGKKSGVDRRLNYLLPVRLRK